MRSEELANRLILHSSFFIEAWMSLTSPGWSARFGNTYVMSI